MRTQLNAPMKLYFANRSYIIGRQSFRRNSQLQAFGMQPGKRQSSQFRMVEHVLPAQHSRHWPRGRDLASDEPLRLAVKQYIPISNTNPAEGDVTFIGLHANGLPKELYEPLWMDLENKMSGEGRKIRSIWVADMTNQGQSALLNEKLLGNDPSWFDFSRDLLFLINQKQREMPQPLVGIGHSVGGAQLAFLSMFHPRLFQALIFIDPTIQTENPGKGFMAASTFRRDTWPSRQAAREKFAGSKFYKAWDPRVFDKWMEYGLRDAPAPIAPDQDSPETPVTLSTTVSQEVFLYQRPKYLGHSELAWQENKLEYGDIHPDDDEQDYLFYRPEPAQIFRRLPELYPSVLYVFGTKSPFSTPELRRKKMQTTGAGVGGSGGHTSGRVEEILVEGSHMVPLENVNKTAEAIADFSRRKIDQWKARAKEEKQQWLQRTYPERSSLDDQWKDKIGKLLPVGKGQKL